MSPDARVAIIAAAALLFGCMAPTKPVPLSAYCPAPDPHVVCAGWAPIITHGADLQLMDPRTVQAIDAHNNYGVVKGCWKPGG